VGPVRRKKRRKGGLEHRRSGDLKGGVEKETLGQFCRNKVEEEKLVRMVRA